MYILLLLHITVNCSTRVGKVHDIFLTDDDVLNLLCYVHLQLFDISYVFVVNNRGPCGRLVLN